MTLAIAIVSFLVGFMLSAMFSLSSKADLEENLEERDIRINLARSYIQVLLTGDLELDKQETLESIDSVLEGKKWQIKKFKN